MDISIINQNHREFSSLSADLFKGKGFILKGLKSVPVFVNKIWEIMNSTFLDLDPSIAQFHLSNEELIGKFQTIRANIKSDRNAIRLLMNIFLECGLEDLYFDYPRFRGITNDGHQNPLAANAYTLHRDQWFANPRAQWNWWIPLIDIVKENSFGIYPNYFFTPVQNNSNLFEYSDWQEKGGFQSYGPRDHEKVFPTTINTPDLSNEYRVTLKTGEIFIFSAHHLHRTLPNTTEGTRFSIDVRTILLDDLLNGSKAPNVDNQSKGTTLIDFFHCPSMKKLAPSWIESLKDP